MTFHAAGPAPRRTLLRGAAGLLALSTAGCGFRPMHGGGGSAASGDPALAADLGATRVGLIPDRFGQLLRRGIQQRLGQGNEPATGARWELLVSPGITREAVGIQRDGTATRVRLIATANWTLLRVAPREPVATGFERAIDAFNLEGSQFFAADASRDAAERRLADQLAEEVATRLAMQFRNLRAGITPQRIAPVEVSPPLPEPTISPNLNQGLPPGVGGGGLGDPTGGPTGGIGGPGAAFR